MHTSPLGNAHNANQVARESAGPAGISQPVQNDQHPEYALLVAFMAGLTLALVLHEPPPA